MSTGWTSERTGTRPLAGSTGDDVPPRQEGQRDLGSSPSRPRSRRHLAAQGPRRRLVPPARRGLGAVVARVSNIADVMADQAIECIRYPIPDTRVPSDRTFEHTLDELRLRFGRARPLSSPAGADLAGPARWSDVYSKRPGSTGRRDRAHPGKPRRHDRERRPGTLRAVLACARRPHMPGAAKPWKELEYRELLGTLLFHCSARRPPGSGSMNAYSGRLVRAAETAARLHAAQLRKGTTIPYVSHLFGTCAIAASSTGRTRIRRSRPFSTTPSRTSSRSGGSSLGGGLRLRGPACRRGLRGHTDSTQAERGARARRHTSRT